MKAATELLNLRRLMALCRKEVYQILRDPSSILIAFVMPVMLLFIYGYAVNLDSDHLRIGLLNQDGGSASRSFEQALYGSSSFELHRAQSREQLQAMLTRGEVRGVVVIGDDFSARLSHPEQSGAAAIQILADGSEPNTAQFVYGQVQGAWAKWLQFRAQDTIARPAPTITIQSRAWYNPSTVSRNFLVPGSIAVVMTVIGALLTSLVVAREWERGTMEALLSTPVTRAELLLSKMLPYYVLGVTAMTLCLLVAVHIMHVPFRGSVLVLWAITSLFLAAALGQGLFISTVQRSQFNAAQYALTSAFLPAMMLSGFVFEISSMPQPLQWLTRIIPARYLTSSLQTLFQAGDVAIVLWPNALFLSLLGLFWLTMTAVKTRRTLD